MEALIMTCRPLCQDASVGNSLTLKRLPLSCRAGDLIIRPSLIERAARESFTTSFQQHLLSAYARSFAALIRGQYDRDKEHNGGRRGCQALLQCE